MRKKYKYTFVHIGKCAGSTVWHSLVSKRFDIADESEYLHLNRLNLSNGHKYIIVIRNPIKRFISAFYWRFKLVVDEESQRNRFKNEYENLLKWGTVENFVQEIGIKGEGIFRDKPNSGNYVHQVHQDIYFYLAPLVDSNNSHRVECVLTQENIYLDMKKQFDIEIGLRIHKNSNPQHDKYLSKSSLKILDEILAPDFYSIQKLYEWEKLSKKQYKLLLNE